jgi:hypothetical protein
MPDGGEAVKLASPFVASALGSKSKAPRGKVPVRRSKRGRGITP